MSKIWVRPVGAAVVPPHPVDGALPAEGGEWTADQFTFRRELEGVIERYDPTAAGSPSEATESGVAKRGG